MEQTGHKQICWPCEMNIQKPQGLLPTLPPNDLGLLTILLFYQIPKPMTIEISIHYIMVFFTLLHSEFSIGENCYVYLF